MAVVRGRAASIALTVVLTTPAALADPLANLTPVRRTTIATADADASLRFYRDLLGFVVEYDKVVDDPRVLALFSPGARTGRAVALRRGEALGGSIGLFESDGVKRAERCEPAAASGDVSILILADDLESLRSRLTAAGVAFLTETVTYSESRGPTDAFTVFDPNCVRVAFARVRGEALEDSGRR